MDICFVSVPLSATAYNDVQKEHLDSFFKLRISHFKKKINGLCVDKLSNILLQNTSLLTLAGFLKSNTHHHITYYDLHVKKASEIPLFDVYALNCFSCNYHIAREAATIIKKKYPHSLIILGGPHATFSTQDVLRDGIFDVVIRKEGEYTLQNVLDRLEHGGDITNINGIAFMKNEGVVINPDNDTLINYVALPDYSFLTSVPTLPAARIFTSRGCPYRCSFCANPTLRNRVIYKSDADIEKELNTLYTTFGTRLFYVGDETFTVNPERALKIMDIFESFKDDAYWIFQTRVDRLPSSLLRKIKESKKLIEINVGIENVEDSILRTNRKGTTRAQIVSSLEELRATGKKVLGYWIVGLPGETKETIKTNLFFMKRFLETGLLYLVDILCFVPFPGCDIALHPNKYGVNIHSTQYDRYTGETFPVYNTSTLSAEEIFAHYLQCLRELTAIYRILYEKENVPVSASVESLDKGLF